ncbi:MAG TPA: sugar transferase [Gemmataceae bacterium]|nr:sugar transferase [Gemmataceae bacterium]
MNPVIPSATLPKRSGDPSRLEEGPSPLRRLPAGCGEPFELKQSWYVAGKRMMDVLLVLVLSLAALPILLVAALLVRLTSRGPAFYSQVRLGRHGQPFSIYKLRTMYHDCERVSGACWSQPGDPRVTRLGSFLRATHLDELPQLWNILLGDMSLVGPRPERPEFAPTLERVIPEYRSRLLVRPGVTGLAQVQLPPDSDITSVRLKVAHDLDYIRHFSGWLDLRILICTIFHVFGLPCHALCRALLGTERELFPASLPSANE